MQTVPGRGLEALAGGSSVLTNQRGLRLGRTIWIWLPVLSCPKVYSCALASGARLKELPKKACTSPWLYPIFLTGFLSSESEEVCYYWFT
jgi:hypothetical protein